MEGGGVMRGLTGWVDSMAWEVGGGRHGAAVGEGDGGETWPTKRKEKGGLRAR
jgi:hypothetical protein